MSHPLPHEVLGVSVQAKAREVRKAYKRLARKYHPDHNPAPEATARFMAVKAAHDEMLRQIEQGGYRAPRPAPPPPPRAAPKPPPRRPPPRRPPPRRAPEPEPPWVTYGVDEGPGARPPPVDVDATMMSYRFEVSDVLRPALYLFGIGSWVVIVVAWASTMRELNVRAQATEPEQEAAAQVDTGRAP